MTDRVLQSSHQAIKQGSKSFATAARLFPSEIRDDASMLYAWCRHCDDEIDGQVMGHGAVGLKAEIGAAKLRELRERTRSALDGAAQDNAVFAAFQRVARRHAIPAEDAMGLLRGFEMDVEGRRYDTLADTMDYAYHVAGVVGVMMARIMGVESRDVLRRAQDLGLAFQLTNIARDVVEDAGGGRVYLPARWLEEEGVATGAVADPANREAVARVATRLVAAAEPYYESARWGLRDLPIRCAWAIATARGVYRAIGHRVVDAGAQAWERRISTGRASKAALLALGGLTALRSGTFDRLRAPPPRPTLWTRI
ncbi:MAG: phytoene/squalene synthase family protein [Alphaproteobacteria bacterium]|nr:phytoene/squalene synthase family protein [Alphaproteobacteria bacterium]